MKGARGSGPSSESISERELPEQPSARRAPQRLAYQRETIRSLFAIDSKNIPILYLLPITTTHIDTIWMANSNEPLTVATKAKAPFDDPDGDIVLRACDKVDFHVHKVILCYASPVFRGMFEANGSGAAQGDTSSGLPVVDLPEHSKLVYELLHLCYPLPHTVCDTLQKVVPLLEVAFKYEMTGVMWHLERFMRAFYTQCALRTYAVACRFSLYDLARDAAKSWLNNGRDVRPYPDIMSSWSESVECQAYVAEMSQISAASYLRLILYRRTGNKSHLTRPIRPLNSSMEQPVSKYKPPHESNIVLRSSDGVDFLFNRSLLLSLPVEFCHNVLPKQERGDARTAVINVPENSTTLSLLLQPYLPTQQSDYNKLLLNHMHQTIHAAKKYNLTKVAAHCRQAMTKYTIRSPMAAYHVAMQNEWRTEARDAALYIARLQIAETYEPEMEDLPAHDYHLLLKFCYSFYSTLSRLSRPVNSSPYCSSTKLSAEDFSRTKWAWKDGWDSSGDVLFVLRAGEELSGGLRRDAVQTATVNVRKAVDELML
ncbi:hypothetical protein K474DRAFT_1702029 [Panus rudis PR-1116 ss-1]|nr:hypothetical protein K474DRAFT_1702029 [Panus rudis PR-1116 ss-1]